MLYLKYQGRRNAKYFCKFPETGWGQHSRNLLSLIIRVCLNWEGAVFSTHKTLEYSTNINLIFNVPLYILLSDFLSLSLMSPRSVSEKKKQMTVRLSGSSDLKVKRYRGGGGLRRKMRSWWLVVYYLQYDRTNNFFCIRLLLLF